MQNFLTKIQNPVKKGILYLLLFAILFFAISLLTKPVRIAWSENYVEAGDEFLAQKNYLKAELEYKKALALFWSNQTAKRRLPLTSKAQANIDELTDFYRETGRDELLSKLQSAEIIPGSVLEAVKATRELIEEGEYQLAAKIGKTSTEMDINYRDAWLYSGIANLKTAKSVELAPSYRMEYLVEAQANLEKALLIDQLSESAAEYLKEAKTFSGNN
jgi:hypothetical protein